MDNRTYQLEERYKTPVEFVIAELSKNKGTQNNVMKCKLVDKAKKLQIVFDEKKVNKRELVEKIIAIIGVEAVAEEYGVGIRSCHWQQKFGISNADIREMATKGFIKITGQERFRAYGEYRLANLYSVFQYYQLSWEEIHKWLTDNKRNKTTSNLT